MESERRPGARRPFVTEAAVGRGTRERAVHLEPGGRGTREAEWSKGHWAWGLSPDGSGAAALGTGGGGLHHGDGHQSGRL